MTMTDTETIEEMAKAIWDRRCETFVALGCRPLPKWHDERGDAKAAVRAEAQAVFECSVIAELRDKAWRYDEVSE